MLEEERLERLSHVRSNVKELREKETKLAMQLSEVRESLKDVCLEEAQLVNIGSPISILPQDILVEIFSYLIPNISDISHVTRHWRDVSICTPSLWATINIRQSSSTHWHLPRLYIERSRRCPLDVTLVFQLEDEDPDPDSEDSIDRKLDVFERMRLISPEFDRIRSLHIHADTPHSEDIIEFLRVELELSRALSLRKLSINVFPDDAINMQRSSPIMRFLTGGAPLLSVLRLDGLTLGSFCPPLGAITYLSFRSGWGPAPSSIPYKLFLDVLTECSSLKRLDITRSVFYPDSTRNEQRVSMPYFEHLAIDSITHFDCPDDYIELILGAVPMQQIRTLYLTRVDALNLENFAALVSKHNLLPLLEHLRLDCQDAATGWITDRFLRATPKIMHLSFMDIRNNATMATFTHLLGPKNEVLWPCLRTASFQVARYSNRELIRISSTICDLLAARIAVQIPLSILRFGVFNVHSVIWLNHILHLYVPELIVEIVSEEDF